MLLDRPVVGILILYITKQNISKAVLLNKCKYLSLKNKIFAENINYVILPKLSSNITNFTRL